MSEFPYAERFPVNRVLPEVGRSREEVLAELQTMANEEDAFWETGKCSGTMYCGDHDHYRFLNEAFGLFAHVNALQRDMCPSATKFEGEIIAMTLDLLHAERRAPTATPGGPGHHRAEPAASCHAMLAYREQGSRAAGRHPAQPDQAGDGPSRFRQGLPSLRHRAAPGAGRPRSRPQVDVDWVADHIDDQTVALVGSACNYGYGTIDPIEELRSVALERGIGLHVDGCLGGFILPFGQELGYDIPAFDFRVPGCDEHLGRHPQVRIRLQGHIGPAFRDKALRNAQYFSLTGLERREVLLAGHGGVALGRAAGGHLGGHGPTGSGRLPPLCPGRSSRPRPPCRPRCGPILSCAS